MKRSISLLLSLAMSLGLLPAVFAAGGSQSADSAAQARRYVNAAVQTILSVQSDVPDRWPGAPYARTADVYAALDAIEAESGSRMTHTEISGVLDVYGLPAGERAEINRMRLYRLSTSPYHMKSVNGSYEIVEGAMYRKPKAFLIAAQHGDERTNPAIVVDLVRRLLWDEEFADVAAAYEWYIIPVVNVYGYNHNTRVNGDGHDINRDYRDNPTTTNGLAYGFVTPEAQAVKAVYTANEFSLFLDLHNANWSGADETRCAFTSIVNLDRNRLAEYKQLWHACDTAGTLAERWARNEPAAVRTDRQICFNWGDPDDPAVGTRASASAYIRGDRTFNKQAANQHTVLCSATVETEKHCRPISGSPGEAYNKVAMSFGAVYVETLVRELGMAVIEHLDVY